MGLDTATTSSVCGRSLLPEPARGLLKTQLVMPLQNKKYPGLTELYESLVCPLHRDQTQEWILEDPSMRVSAFSWNYSWSLQSVAAICFKKRGGEKKKKKKKKKVLCVDT